MQAIAAFERIADAAPMLHVYGAICAAWLEHIRGRSDRALSLMRAVIDTPAARGLLTRVINQTLYARLLNAAGAHDRAIEVCTDLLGQPERQDEDTPAMRGLQRELAVAEASSGKLTQALARVEAQLARALPLGNPLEIGASHRDRARIALVARDAATFDQHLAAMDASFRATKHPCLIAQIDVLIAAAVKAGLRGETRAAQCAPHDLSDDLTDVQTLDESVPPPSRDRETG